jgi:hypothetical protein
MIFLLACNGGTVCGKYLAKYQVQTRKIVENSLERAAIVL